MSLKSIGRSFEKRCVRPLFHRIKRFIRVSGAHDRIATLEARVEQLESLFREQAGLHYLRLMDEAEVSTGAPPAAPMTRREIA